MHLLVRCDELLRHRPKLGLQSSIPCVRVGPKAITQRCFCCSFAPIQKSGLLQTEITHLAPPRAGATDHSSSPHAPTLSSPSSGIIPSGVTALRD